MRIEKDFLGTMDIPDEALYGIHSARARENFPNSDRFHPEWYMATGKVKIACYRTILKFRKAIESEQPELTGLLRLPSEDMLNTLITAASEVSEGQHFDHFIVPAVQGGAGTSINLNINEIIANRSLQLSGKTAGEYDIIDPIETANIYQSTNDVIPTALKVAVMELLQVLESAINRTRRETEQLENRYRNTLRISYTQLEEAVPGTYGQLFSGYSEAFSRDWWRISKASERIKQVNLGGGATGSGTAIPRFYIMEVVNQLQKITGLPLARGENLHDITSNNDALVEVHAVIKAHAVNLQKMVNDLRLLASGVAGRREIRLPGKQTGSSIMPGKVNPVIPEFIIASAHQVYANDQLITSLAAMGDLDLNAFIPSIGHAMLQSLKLMIAMNDAVQNHLLCGLKVDEKSAAEGLFKSPAVTTALSPLIGYHKAAELANYMKQHQMDIFQANDAIAVVPPAKLKMLMKPESLLKKGFTLDDIREFNTETP